MNKKDLSVSSGKVSIMAQRKLFILEVMNFILLVYRAVCIDQLVAVLVERQLGNDTVHFSSAHNVISCNTDDKVTYLVDDKKCVSNQELLNGNHSLHLSMHKNDVVHDC